MSQPTFNPSNEPGTCPWCGRKLVTGRKWSDGSPREMGYPPFDTMRCATWFAQAAHENGYRFAPKSQQRPPGRET